MRTFYYYTVSAFIGLNLLGILACSKENPDGFFTGFHEHQISTHEVQNIPAGIYKGEVTYLKNGIAYSWLEFKAVDDLDNVGIVFPIKEILNQSTVSGSYNNSSNIEISMPNANRCKEIFNQIIVNTNSINPKTGLPVGPYVSFNFYLNASPFNSSGDCNAHHALSKMPAVYRPILLPGGCINGLGLLWEPAIESNENSEIEMLLGSANADLAFYSPTATVTELIKNLDFTDQIPLPVEMTPMRYYPTQYHITQTGDNLLIILEKFVQRK